MMFSSVMVSREKGKSQSECFISSDSKQSGQANHSPCIIMRAKDEDFAIAKC